MTATAKWAKVFSEFSTFRYLPPIPTFFLSLILSVRERVEWWRSRPGEAADGRVGDDHRAEEPDHQQHGSGKTEVIHFLTLYTHSCAHLNLTSEMLNCLLIIPHFLTSRSLFFYREEEEDKLVAAMLKKKGTDSFRLVFVLYWSTWEVRSVHPNIYINIPKSSYICFKES